MAEKLYAELMWREWNEHAWKDASFWTVLARLALQETRDPAPLKPQQARYTVGRLDEPGARIDVLKVLDGREKILQEDRSIPLVELHCHRSGGRNPPPLQPLQAARDSLRYPTSEPGVAQAGE